MIELDMHKINKQTMVQQAITYLREYILGIEDEYNLKLPSESDIAKKMGLSRLTIREALTVLESEGLIAKNQGSSTMITTFARKLSENIDYTGELGSFISDCGYELDVKVLSFKWDKPSKETANILNLKDEDEILVVKKVFIADGRPAAFCINRLSKNILNNLDFDIENLGKSMFDFVLENSSHVFSHDYMELIPEIVTKELADILGLEVNSPILRVDVVKYTTDGLEIMYNTEYYVDNLIRFSALRSDYGNKLSKLGSTINRRKGD